MNWLDLILVIVVGVTAFMGLKIGLVRAGFTALGIFVGSILGGQLSDDIGSLVAGTDSDSAVATVVSYAIIISICLTVAAVASVIIRKVLTLLAGGLGGQAGRWRAGSGRRRGHIGRHHHGNGEPDL